MQSIPIVDCGDGVVRAVAGALGSAGPMLTKTAAYTIKASDTGTTFDNLAAAGSVTFTLPAPKAGLVFYFQVKTVGQTIVVTAPTAGTMKGPVTPYTGITITSAGANQFSFLELYSDGTNWYALGFGTWTIS